MKNNINMVTRRALLGSCAIAMASFALSNSAAAQQAQQPVYNQPTQQMPYGAAYNYQPNQVAQPTAQPQQYYQQNQQQNQQPSPQVVQAPAGTVYQQPAYGQPAAAQPAQVQSWTTQTRPGYVVPAQPGGQYYYPQTTQSVPAQYDPEYHQRVLAYCRGDRDGGLGGALTGAAAGGLAGHAIAGRGEHTEGTLIGAGVGALAGLAIDLSEDDCDDYLERHQYDQAPQGYYPPQQGYYPAPQGYAYPEQYVTGAGYATPGQAYAAAPQTGRYYYQGQQPGAQSGYYPPAYPAIDAERQQRLQYCEREHGIGGALLGAAVGAAAGYAIAGRGDRLAGGLIGGGLGGIAGYAIDMSENECENYIRRERAIEDRGSQYYQQQSGYYPGQYGWYYPPATTTTILVESIPVTTTSYEYETVEQPAKTTYRRRAIGKKSCTNC